MLENTHRWIASQISGYLRIKEKDAAILERGSILPDYEMNFPHHTGKENEIINKIKESRELFINNDDECYIILGILLHYIQDSYTKRPRIHDKHTKWEKEINDIINKTISIKEYNPDGSFSYSYTVGVPKIIDVYSFLNRDETDDYVMKAWNSLYYNYQFFEENLNDLALPSSSKDYYKSYASLYRLSYKELLYFHRDLKKIKEGGFLFDGRDLEEYLEKIKNKEYIFTERQTAYKLLYIDGENISDLTYSETIYDALLGWSLIQRQKWSHPYIDLYFALLYSLKVSMKILEPVELSEIDWSGDGQCGYCGKKSIDLFSVRRKEEQPKLICRDCYKSYDDWCQWCMKKIIEYELIRFPDPEELRYYYCENCAKMRIEAERAQGNLQAIIKKIKYNPRVHGY